MATENLAERCREEPGFSETIIRQDYELLKEQVRNDWGEVVCNAIALRDLVCSNENCRSNKREKILKGSKFYVNKTTEKISLYYHIKDCEVSNN